MFLHVECDLPLATRLGLFELTMNYSILDQRGLARRIPWAGGDVVYVF